MAEAEPDCGARCVIRRDLLLAMRRKSDVLTTLFFFVIVVSLFPLGIGPEMAMLRQIAPGVLWVAALLATMLSLPACSPPTTPTARWSRWRSRPRAAGVLVTGKVLAHWLLSGLPLALLAPVLGLQFDLAAALGVLALALLIGTPVLSPDRRHRRGADFGRARRRRAAVAAGAAAVCAGADLRRRRGGGRHRPAWARRRTCRCWRPAWRWRLFSPLGNDWWL
jgi:hypothetical protein